VNLQQIITAALQVAIQAHRQGQPVEAVQKTALGKFWRDYADVAGSKEAANRAITNYYATANKPKPAPLVVVERTVEPVVKPYQPPSQLQVLADELRGNPGHYTSQQLLELAPTFRVHVRKSWSKLKIVAAFHEAAKAEQELVAA
jgi:hypothetical protein